jgi:hypothetical protein
MQKQDENERVPLRFEGRLERVPLGNVQNTANKNGYPSVLKGV